MAADGDERPADAGVPIMQQNAKVRRVNAAIDKNLSLECDLSIGIQQPELSNRLRSQAQARVHVAVDLIIFTTTSAAIQKNGRQKAGTHPALMPTQPPPGPWGLVGG